MQRTFRDMKDIPYDIIWMGTGHYTVVQTTECIAPGVNPHGDYELRQL